VTRRRILIVTADTLGARMAGPAIRAWHLADALAHEHDVDLVTTGLCEVGEGQHVFGVRSVDDVGLRRALHRTDVLIFQGWIAAGRPWIITFDGPIVCDIYDPMHLEQLEQARDLGLAQWRRAVHGATAVLNEQLRRGDYFICASEKQRDLWLGQLAGVGRINPATYADDGSLRRLIEVVPFGVGDDEPVRGRSAIRGVFPGVDADSKVVLWGGGLYNWFDPLTLLHAVDRLRHSHPEVRLVFMGMRHPNPEVPQMRMAAAAERLAHELGLAGKFVHFNRDWVPFDERKDHLLDADIGVSTHFDHVETEFSFRTRILDYLWAGLPVVTTGGDALALMIDQRGAGAVVPPVDVEALADALAALLDSDERMQEARRASRALADELRWSAVVEPLLRYCRDPRRAPDLLDPVQQDLARQNLVMVTSTRSRMRNNVLALRNTLRDDGISVAMRRTLERVRRNRVERRP
jgi:glycosyltransferase involved in cell wall biosynthesis